MKFPSAEITETNVANEFGSQYALYQITITKMSGSDDSKTYWTYRRYSDFHDIDIRLREVLGESDFPLELPKKEKFSRCLDPLPTPFGGLDFGLGHFGYG